MMSRKLGDRKRRRRILLAIGIGLIVFGAVWRLSVVPWILSGGLSQTGGDRDSGEESKVLRELSGGEENITVAEGQLGILGLILKLRGEDENETFNFLNMTIDDFELIWVNVTITSKGMYNRDTGEPLFDDEEKDKVKDTKSRVKKKEKKFFPKFGVEKRDYEIWNDGMNTTVTARYHGETTVYGRHVYIYVVDIDNAKIELGSGFGQDGKNTFFNVGDSNSVSSMNIRGVAVDELSVYYSETTKYYIDPITSIPIDVKITSCVQVTVPDLRVLPVHEGETVEVSEGEIWVERDTVPHTYEKIAVLVEHHQKSYILAEDSNIAIFEDWEVYYDKSTGEPLDAEYQPETEVYAVDRTTFKYVPGYGNSLRRGYYTFPIGNIEKTSYAMWDEYACQLNTAYFVREEFYHETLTYVYEMYTENVSVDSANLFFPVYRHPGTEYTYSGVSRIYVDARSGIPIDVYVEGYYWVAPAGPAPAPGPSYPVAKVNFSFDPATVELLRKLARLYAEVLIPISCQQLPMLAVKLQFAKEFINIMLRLAELLATYLNWLRLWIPTIFITLGGILIGVGAYSILRKRKRQHV